MVYNEIKCFKCKLETPQMALEALLKSLTGS